MRHQALFMAWCTLALSTAFAGDKVEYGPAPEWVKAVTRPANDDTMAQAPVKSLLQSMQYRFTATGSVAYTESYSRVQTPQGLAALGNIAMPWKPDSDVLTVHKFELLRGDKVIDILAAGQTFEVLRRENNLEYSALDGILTATLQPSGMEVGDVVHIAFSLRRESRLLPDPELIVLGLNDMPLSRVELRATWDKGVPMHWRATEQVKGLKESRNGNLVELNWIANQLTPITQPKNVPWRYWQEPRIAFSSYGSWNDVSKKIGSMYTKAATLEPGSPLKAEARAIADASADAPARIEAVLRLAQDRVRYVFLGMNEGGINPAAADLTWTRRFGDCKGKSALILALLHELGIEAEPVAVNTYLGDVVQGTLPSVGIFNHVIVRAHEGKRTWWLDGAGSGSWRRIDMQTPNYSWGLPMTAKGDGLVRMIAEPAAEPLLETHTTIDARAGLHTDAPFKAETLVRGGSGAALHTQLSGLTPADMERGLRDYWKKEYSFVEVKNVAARFDEKAGVEILTMDGTADMEWGGYSYTTDGLDVGFRANFKREPGINVDAPFLVDHPAYKRVTQRIELPTVGTFTTRGKDYDVTVSGMHYVRQAKIENRVFTGTMTVRSMTSEVTAVEARAAEKTLNDMWRDDIEVVAENYRATDEDVATLRKRDFDDGPNLRWRGNIFMDRSDYDAAIADFDKALKLDEKDYDALANRGIAHYWKRNYDLARSDFETVLARQPANAVALRGLGAVFQANAKYPEAITRLSDSLRIDPDNTFALAHRAYAYRNSGDEAKAVADASDALRVDPSYLDMYALRASVFIEQEDKTPVLREADAMIKAMPDNPEALMAAAYYYDRTAHRTEALAAVDKALAIQPSAAFYIARADMRDPADQRGRLADVDAALAIDPNLEVARGVRAYLLEKSGDYAGAIAIYDAQIKAVTRGSSLQRDLWTRRGLAYWKSGQQSRAQKDFAAALADDPDSDSYNSFCWRLALENIQLDAALAACEKAVALYPKDSRFLDSKAFVLLRLGRLDESVAAYDAALAIEPKLTPSLYGRGVAKNRQCKCEAGAADIAAARRLEPMVERYFDGALPST